MYPRGLNRLRKNISLYMLTKFQIAFFLEICTIYEGTFEVDKGSKLEMWFLQKGTYTAYVGAHKDSLLTTNISTPNHVWLWKELLFFNCSYVL